MTFTKIGVSFVAAVAAVTLSSGAAVAQQGQAGKAATPTGDERRQNPAPRPGQDAPPTPTGQQTAGSSKADAKSSNSQAFVKEAAIGGMAEVELGRLASEKASSDQVKKFGQRMVTDHGKANEELKSLAQSKGIAVPSEPDAKHKQTRDRLSKLSGVAFDRAYMDEMLQDHKKDVSAFQKQSASGSDPEIKAWAAKTLPVLQEHLQLVERTHADVAGTTGTKRSSTGNTESSSPPVGSDRGGSTSGKDSGGATPSGGNRGGTTRPEDGAAPAPGR
jgi:putative membrane protein